MQIQIPPGCSTCKELLSTKTKTKTKTKTWLFHLQGAPHFSTQKQCAAERTKRCRAKRIVAERLREAVHNIYDGKFSFLATINFFVQPYLRLLHHIDGPFLLLGRSTFDNIHTSPHNLYLEKSCCKTNVDNINEQSYLMKTIHGLGMHSFTT